MPLRRTAGWALASAIVACPASGCHSSSPASDDGGEPCPTGFLGSDAAAPDFDFQVLLAGGTVAALVDGGTVPLIEPPQGGRVLFIGVQATNVDGCALQLTGVLRDLSTNKASLDGRTINLLPLGNGWGGSGQMGSAVSADISHFSNIPACPNEWSATNIYGTVYGLEVTIQDREGRTLTKKIVVTPECGEPATLAECLCICKGGYVLGESCGDGGSEQ